MRTRTIVALAAAGLALVLLDRPGGPGADDAKPARIEAPVELPTPPAPPPVVKVTTTVEATTTTTPTTTGPPTTAAPEIEGRGRGAPVEARWPLLRALPHEAEGWRIDYRVEAGQLVLSVTVRAVLNRADQLEASWGELRSAKAEVLAWLASAGQAASTYRVEWRPAQTAGL